MCPLSNVGKKSVINIRFPFLMRPAILFSEETEVHVVKETHLLIHFNHFSNSRKWYASLLHSLANRAILM